MQQTGIFSCYPSFMKRGRGLTSSAVSLFKKAFSAVPTGALINTAIDALPIELHLPTYQYCGPGTKLRKRLKRGDPGINKLDEACKAHDIAYSNYSDSEKRSIADRALAEKAWQRVKSSDASVAERAAALAVTAAMKAKTAVGGGSRRRKRNTYRRKRVSGGGTKKRRNTHKRKRCSKCSKKKSNGGGLYLRPYRAF
jgi:hypothetical protein